MATDADARATGRCLCGDVSFVVTGALRDVFDCHCERCRRFSGHHVAATAAAPTDVHVDGSTLRWFSPHPSVEYGFCQRCGSSLFWRPTTPGGPVSIMAGSLDQPTGLRTTEVWWVVETADYVDRPSGRVEYERDG